MLNTYPAGRHCPHVQKWASRQLPETRLFSTT
jgi:hypothetical protein